MSNEIATQNSTETPERLFPRITNPSPDHVVYAVEDGHDAPLFMKGEYVVADPHDTKAKHDSIVLVEWSAGRRGLMSTRVGRGEWSDQCVRVYENGPHELWWFDPVVRPRTSAEMDAWRRAGRIMSTSDGPFRAEHLQESTVGRIVGVAAGDAALQWARKQSEDRDREVDELAERAAREFDPDLYTQLFDRTGQIYAVYDSPNGTVLAARMVRGCDHEERLRIYRDHTAIFAAARDGHEHSDRKLEVALRNAGRVITWDEAGHSIDARMPDHVRSAHVSEAGIFGGLDG